MALDEAKKSSPAAVFDSVFIPALIMARRDHQEGDLDKADLRFVLAGAREAAEEVIEVRDTPAGDPGERVRVLVCPTRDETEHVAADLLALTLDPNRWEVKVSGDETLASEVVEHVASFRPGVVVIAAMPPSGLAHVKYLLTKIRQRFPEVKLLVGRWVGEEGTIETRSETIQFTDGVDLTLNSTRQRLGELYHQLATANKDAAERPEKKALVGTAGA